MAESSEQPRILALREIVEERKGKAVETLSASYAKNKLPLEEYERLVEYINKIESERELIIIEKIVAEYNGSKTPSENSAYTDDEPASYDDDDDDIPDYSRPYNNLNTNLAFFSARTVSGPLKNGSQYLSIFGSQQIKIRKADIRQGRTFLDVVSLFGDNTILVEDGIQVVNKAIPIFGNSDLSRKINNQAHNGNRELIISGAAMFGNISVKLLKE
jgi:hypothetical protein